MNKNADPRSRKTLRASFYIVTILSIIVYFYLIHLRLLEIEKIRCQTWHWQVCDEILAQK